MRMVVGMIYNGGSLARGWSRIMVVRVLVGTFECFYRNSTLISTTIRVSTRLQLVNCEFAAALKLQCKSSEGTFTEWLSPSGDGSHTSAFSSNS